MKKISRTFLYKLGIGMLSAAIVLTAILAIRQAITTRAEERVAEKAADGTAMAAITASKDTVDLPLFPTPESQFSRGISRMVSMDTNIPKRPTVDVITYTVQAGDNLFLIADQYGLKPETILWGNYDTLRDNPQMLSIGQVLNILPTNGVYYKWKEGDTLAAVAEFFKVDPEAILEYAGNRLLPDMTKPQEPQIAAGTWLIIPGGKRMLKDWGPPPISRLNPAAAAYYGEGYCGQIYEGAVGTGSFIWPTVATYLSGYDYNPPIHFGIDIAGAMGNAIYAVDSGVVVYAGWSQYGYGNLVVLDHGNGWQSAYAHLNTVGVSCGQSVGQGTVIAGLGTTGNSTGPHLHFELYNSSYGKVNPWDFLIHP